MILNFFPPYGFRQFCHWHIVHCTYQQKDSKRMFLKEHSSTTKREVYAMNPKVLTALAYVITKAVIKMFEEAG